VLLITYLSAKSIKKLHPLAALRQGFSSHSFKRNNLPLAKSRGSLSRVLAFKSALQNKGQMIMIFIIIFAVSFAAAVGVAGYDNIGLHPEGFVNAIIGEVCDAAFVVKYSEDSPRVMANIKSKSETRKAFYFDQAIVLIDELEIANIIIDDLSLLEGSMLYDGRYPKHDNEIAIGGKYSGYSGKNIGDTISVTVGDKTMDYFVVGLVQATNQMGLITMMTADGMERLNPDFGHNMIYVYLHESSNDTIADFIKEIEKESGGVLDASINQYEFTGAQLGMYGVIFAMVAAVIMVVTVFVIILVLYLVLKTVIIRRKRMLGVQKALGFTTLQLMNQLSLNYIPVIALAVVVGGFVGALGFSPIFGALVRSMGIMNVSMPAPVIMTITICVGMLIVAYIFSMLISWRIRKISVYELVSE
jgi:putative ABC transport system permease protein